jgi:hypothetical protein
LSWLIELNVALWGFILPMSGVFALIRFKKGGPYDSEGTYISNLKALFLLLVSFLLYCFVLNPVVRILVESLCLSNPIMEYVLFLIALIVMWNFIVKSRKRES